MVHAGPGEPQSAWPELGNFTNEEVWRCAIREICTAARTLPSSLSPSSAADAGDYGYPVGVRSRQAPPTKRLPGSIYRPLYLSAADCSSSYGLLYIVLRLQAEYGNKGVHQLVRVDINLYWRVMKAACTQHFQGVLAGLKNITFALSPWHSMKQLATEIWHTLCPGALNREHNT